MLRVGDEDSLSTAVGRREWGRRGGLWGLRGSSGPLGPTQRRLAASGIEEVQQFNAELLRS